MEQIKRRGVRKLCTSHHVLGFSVRVVGVHVFEWETPKKFGEKVDQNGTLTNIDCGGR
jgi:hypothetical protein